MENKIIAAIRTSLIAISGFCVIGVSPIWGQQHVIAGYDNPRPEVKASVVKPAFITSLNATKWNGYNEVQFTASRQEDTRKFIAEYSTDGVNYQTAGELLVDNRMGYTIKHYTLDERPMLYRVRSELVNGKFAYTGGVLLDGVPVSPVKLYPTVITGNTVNINSAWPIERIQVYASNGSQVFVKEIGGQRDYIPVVIPALSKGMYWMTFYGAGWKATEKFVIQ